MSITQSKRLHILYDDYSINPTKTIQSFIGMDAEIINIKENSIVSDGYIVVDVDYKVMDLDPTKIYFIKFGDCRKINMKKDNCYIVTIDGINVCVNVRKLQGLTDESMVPVHINPVIPTSREQTLYKYYGQIVDTPFHNANSQSFSYNHELVTLEDCQKCDQDEVIFTTEQIKLSYDETIGKLPFNARATVVDTNNIKRIKSTNDVDNDKYYIIDIRKVDTQTGLLCAVKYREHPWDVLYIPLPNYKITKRKYQNLLTYMYYDYQNYTKWLEYNKST